ncbi:hypothetical protein ACAW74_20315 [Fibrella sp. WM1]|uniref:hypothetical protein n=1 Tax=Fibrella musci TaxID=3242485 RepID=UPI00352266AA
MKTILTCLLLSLCTLAQAQKNNLSIQIDDDTKYMSIDVAGTQDGRLISYNHRFGVAGLNTRQREALKDRVLDSLGVSGAATPPRPPKPPAPPRPRPEGESVTIRCESCNEHMRLEIYGTGYTLLHETDSRKERTDTFPMALTLKPGNYRLVYSQNRVLQRQSTFTVTPDEPNIVVIK